MQSLDSLLLLLQTVEHQLPLGCIEVDSCDFLRTGDGIDGDVGAGGELRPQHARKERRAEPDPREIAHEMTAVDFFHA